MTGLVVFAVCFFRGKSAVFPFFNEILCFAALSNLLGFFLFRHIRKRSYQRHLLFSICRLTDITFIVPVVRIHQVISFTGEHTLCPAIILNDAVYRALYGTHREYPPFSTDKMQFGRPVPACYNIFSFICNLNRLIFISASFASVSPLMESDRLNIIVL